MNRHSAIHSFRGLRQERADFIAGCGEVAFNILTVRPHHLQLENSSAVAARALLGEGKNNVKKDASKSAAKKSKPKK